MRGGSEALPSLRFARLQRIPKARLRESTKTLPSRLLALVLNVVLLDLKAALA